ncbi:Hypothetical protein ACI5QN_02528 [Bacillus cereus]
MLKLFVVPVLIIFEKELVEYPTSSFYYNWLPISWDNYT